MRELPDLTDWNDMFELPFKMKKEDYLKTFDNMDALTFVTNGIDIFGNDFFEFLNDKSFKDSLAIKLFNESIDTDCWAFYRRLVNLYGVDTLLKIYNNDTLSKIVKDGHLYIVIAAMLEDDVNYVLEYALTDNEFLTNLINNAPYYYSLFNSINYDLIKKYLIKDFDFVKNYFIMNNNDYEKLFNDSDIDENTLSKIITKIYDINFISNFFVRVARGRVYLIFAPELFKPVKAVFQFVLLVHAYCHKQRIYYA